jgi:hypothetical protein
LGIFVATVGIFIELRYSNLSYDPRIITALGILLVGVGVGHVVRYRIALKDARSATQLIVEEQDERSILIRSRAGNRAYWVSTLLAFAGLMWVSFAGNGALPEMAGDALWYFLATIVVIPFVMYVLSIMIDERNY